MATQNFAISKQGGTTPIQHWDVDDLTAAINLLALLQAGGWDTAAHRDAAILTINAMRTVLVNLGLMKGAA